MILLCGIASEAPLALVGAELRRLEAPYVVFHQRNWAACQMIVEVRDGRAAGLLRLGGLELALEDVTAVYTRLMDDSRLPELAALPAGHPRRERCRALHDVLSQWHELTAAVVVNRPSCQGSNASKPFQAQIVARHGFRVPETLITSDPEAVLDFRARHDRIVFKSISGVRSIVREVAEADLRRLDLIRWCPVQFQAFVGGIDVRVHCVGETVYATRIDSDATDYRYAGRESGEAAALSATTIPDDVSERCVRLTRDLGLELSGIDLRHTPEGEWFCFEVNPSPAFSYYETGTGQPIAAAIAELLTAREG